VHNIKKTLNGPSAGHLYQKSNVAFVNVSPIFFSAILSRAFPSVNIKDNKALAWLNRLVTNRFAEVGYLNGKAGSTKKEAVRLR
jgi:hypothetical protein